MGEDSIEKENVNENAALLGADEKKGDAQKTNGQNETSKKSSILYNAFCGVSLTILVVSVFGLLGAAAYLIYSTPKVSKDFQPICNEGLCYEITDIVFGNMSNPSYSGLIGLKNNLVNLKSIGVDTIILSMKYIDEHNEYTNFSRLEDLFLHSRKLGISIILSLNMKDPIQESVSIEKAKQFVQGFLLIGNHSYETYKAAIGDFPYYIESNNLKKTDKLPPGCNGTFKVADGTIEKDLLKNLKLIYAAPSYQASADIIGFNNLLSQNIILPERQFFTSLVLFSMFQGATYIKGGDEIVNFNPQKYFFKHFSHPLKDMKETMEKMKELYQLRKYAPFIGSNTMLDIVQHETIYFIKRYAVQENTHACLIFNYGSKPVNINLYSLFPNEDITKFHTIFSAYTNVENKDLKSDSLKIEAGGIVILTVDFNVNQFSINDDDSDGYVPVTILNNNY